MPPGVAASSVRFHPEARRDSEGARGWYAERSILASRAFLTELIASVETVREAPERWGQYLAGTRRYYFPKFPFSLIYRLSGDTITVVAVVHHRKKPGYWRKRLDDPQSRLDALGITEADIAYAVRRVRRKRPSR